MLQNWSRASRLAWILWGFVLGSVTYAVVGHPNVGMAEALVAISIAVTLFLAPPILDKWDNDSKSKL